MYTTKDQNIIEKLKEEKNIIKTQADMLETYFMPKKINACELCEKLLAMAIENNFIYCIINSEQIKPIIKKIYKNKYNIPEGKLEQAIKYISKKEKKMFQKLIKYEKFLQIWKKNAECICEDFHWINNTEFQKHLHKDNFKKISFEKTCEMIDVQPNKIRDAFKILQKYPVDKIIDAYQAYIKDTIVKISMEKKI